MVASAGIRDGPGCKNELFWDRGITPSAREPLDQPEAESGSSEPPPRLAAASPERPETSELVPEEWRATPADQLLAFTCCWPELEEPSLPAQSTSEGDQPSVSPEEGRPPAWPLALLPFGLYALWWIGNPRRGLRAVRAGDAGRVAARSLTGLHHHNTGRGVREPREASGEVPERPRIRQDEEHLSCHQFSTRLDERIASLFVLPANQHQHVSLASLVHSPDQMAQSSVRSRLVTG
jgi:hypothetical protein